MKPTFKTAIAWEQAQLLMQPALIRVVDNLRKQLETSSWQGTYEEVELPVPGYKLRLNKGDRETCVDIWHLCFQVCFMDYPMAGDREVHSDLHDYPVDIDADLLDDGEEVNWQQLETKTQQIVHTLFTQLALDELA